ncbi:TRAP transporter small permease subunit [Pararhodobacter oceanensis]|uniref:TRAP transporter small permease protein n=1 Tax=Pararhodobacter oceanensis TaxID=2172121 RepID=A0A2T8HUV4_9RHOB|nr:TRAP transporter small permease subunit [Pararhodobacter oceanensis]PVH29237.1 C4-dicarboxylate ABC transporter permease [Pararhodobacter oceanensis]
MHSLSVIMRAINGLNRLIGGIFSWLSVAIVVVCFWVVIERYFFGNTRLWMQDLYPWLSGVMFTAVAGYALLNNDHVRVDIFYRPTSSRNKAWMDLIGVLVFLLPFTYVVAIYCYTFVARSWGLREGSANPGGAEGLFLVKGFILVFAATLALQGISMLIRSILILRGREDLVPHDYRYETLMG